MDDDDDNDEDDGNDNHGNDNTRQTPQSAAVNPLGSGGD